MAVPGSERKFNICDRCFASVPAKEPFCQECGAPIVAEDQGTEGSDAVVYTELARANLLRMRGEYKQAEDQCLNILKRFPNNASANTLLGDISAEQGDLTQAVQWYELSLDLVPDDDAVKTKLKAVQERISLQEAATTAKELGLPAGNSRKTQYVIITLVLFLMVATAGYLFGTKQSASADTKQPATVRKPIKIPPSDGGGTGGGSSVDENNSGADLKDQTPGASELPLLHRLESASADGAKVLAVMKDPRNESVIVVYQADQADFRALGARLAQSLLTIDPDTLKVTVRAMRGGSLYYTADVNRSQLNETTGQTWKSQNSADAWIDYVLKTEWFAAAAKKVETPPEQPSADTKGADNTKDGPTVTVSEPDSKAPEPAKPSDQPEKTPSGG